MTRCAFSKLLESSAIATNIVAAPINKAKCVMVACFVTQLRRQWVCHEQKLHSVLECPIIFGQHFAPRLIFHICSMTNASAGLLSPTTKHKLLHRWTHYHRNWGLNFVLLITSKIRPRAPAAEAPNYHDSLKRTREKREVTLLGIPVGPTTSPPICTMAAEGNTPVLAVLRAPPLLKRWHMSFPSFASSNFGRRRRLEAKMRLQKTIGTTNE